MIDTIAVVPNDQVINPPGLPLLVKQRSGCSSSMNTSGNGNKDSQPVRSIFVQTESSYRRSRGSSRRIRYCDHEDDTRSGVLDMTVTITQIKQGS